MFRLLFLKSGVSVKVILARDGLNGRRLGRYNGGGTVCGLVAVATGEERDEGHFFVDGLAFSVGGLDGLWIWSAALAMV